MKSWLKISLGLLVWMGALGSGCSGTETNQPVTAAAAIQAIQQAADPSAVVAAYGSGLAVAPNDPKLYEAYVARMVDMGLPEMAFHQAQTLTTLEPNNGLAWGVVAYVDARRGQMPGAVSAINLAGQFASSNKFVAHTAGEILAWYDLKADKAQIPDNAKDGLKRIRGLLDKQPVFTEAYDTARKAYQTQTSAAQPSASAAPAETAAAAPGPATQATAPASFGAYAPQAVTAPQTVLPTDQGGTETYVSPPVEPVYTPVYYPAYSDWGPDYCYDWGPGWVAPSPSCWWYPCGYWGGCSFFPFGLTFAFGDYDDFGHFHHGDGYGHGDGFGHHGDFGHGHGFADRGSFGNGGNFGHHSDPAVWHNGGHGTSSFFGTPARPNSSLTQRNQQGFGERSSNVAAGTSSHWWSKVGQSGITGTRTPNASAGTTIARNGARAPQGIWSGSTAAGARRDGFSRAPVASAPATHFWSGTAGAAQGYRAAPTARSAYAAPAYRAPAYQAPRYAVPTSRSFGGYRSFPSYGGGWARSARSYSAPAPRSFSGGFSGGSSRSFGGGGFSGGHSFGGGGFHGGGFGGGHGGGFGGSHR